MGRSPAEKINRQARLPDTGFTFEEFSTTVEDELFVPNYSHHDPDLPPELQRGRDAYKQLVAMFRAGFPDIKMTVEDLVAEGEEVVARWI